jgi:hypothetical protein
MAGFLPLNSQLICSFSLTRQGNFSIVIVVLKKVTSNPARLRERDPIVD